VKQPLAIVGASVRSAAASALRAGFQPLAADLFADADLRQIATATHIRPYPEGLIDWLRAIEPPAWMYTGAIENHPELVDQMAWIAPLLGNPGDVLARVRSPWELAHALRDADQLFPEIRESDAGLPCDGSWLAKTYAGASGSGVSALVETGRQADKETRRRDRKELASDSPCLPLSFSPCLVFQRRLSGIPCAAIYVGCNGAATLFGVTRQLIGESWLGAHGFQYAGSIGPWPISDASRATLSKIGNTLAERFELIGLFGVDFILDGETVWTLEVNPRYTASVEIVERMTAENAIAAHVAACRENIIRNPQSAARLSSPKSIRNPRSHGKVILFAKRDIVISHAFADYSLIEALRTPWPMLADVSAAGTAIANGRPILTVFADGASLDEVERRLRTRVAEIEAKVYAYD
jgi:uncharacterized protein